MRKLNQLWSRKPFLLFVSLPVNSPELARIAFDCGADAVKVHTNVHHRASGTHFGTWTEEKKAIEEILSQARGPIGILPGGEVTMSPAEMKDAASLGIDFFDIYDYQMPCWMLEIEMGKMIAAGEHYCLEGVRTLDNLGMDYLEASIVSPGLYRQPLTVSDLEAYSLIVSTTNKPVVIPSQKKILPGDLAALKRIGTQGVILGTVAIGATPQDFSKNLPAYVQAIHSQT